MKILHYNLGMPPYRSGGLTNISMEIIMEEKRQGHYVDLMWPGNIVDKNPYVKYHKSTIVDNYELINPLPVPIIFGVKEPSKMCLKRDVTKVLEFLDSKKYDVIHLHTLMGLYKEIIDYAKLKKIKIVYTTHDYYGICLKTTLYNNKICSPNPLECSKCNANSYSLNKLRFFQTPIYRLVKRSSIFSLVKKIFNKKNKNKINNILVSSKKIDEYNNLMSYYKEFFELVDVFHFNSEISKEEYEKHLGNKLNGRVIGLFYDGKGKNNPIASEKQIINLAYMGPQRIDKGYYFLKEVIKKYDNIKLHTYGINEKDNHIINHSKYKYSNLDKVMSKIDIVIIPSLWKETFGLGVVEALYFCKPVICSSCVGAKQILEKNKYGWVYNTKEELEDILNGLTINIINQKSNYIFETYKALDKEEFTKELINLYK